MHKSEIPISVLETSISLTNRISENRVWSFASLKSGTGER